MSVSGPDELMSVVAAWATGAATARPVAKSATEATNTVSRKAALFMRSTLPSPRAASSDDRHVLPRNPWSVRGCRNSDAYAQRLGSYARVSVVNGGYLLGLSAIPETE